MQSLNSNVRVKMLTFETTFLKYSRLQCAQESDLCMGCNLLSFDLAPGNDQEFGSCTQKPRELPLCANIYCSECVSYANMDEEGVCTCQLGYYKSDVTENSSICVKCPPLCKLCSSENNCSECRTESSLVVMENNQCICMNGFYYDLGLSNFLNPCFRCDMRCKKCSISKSNCTECLYRDPIPVNGKCECDLMHYYDKNEGECTTCDNFCLTCVNISRNCTQCIDDPSIILLGINCVCNTNYYYNEQDQTCKKCDDSCSGCSSGPTEGCAECYIKDIAHKKGNKCECIDGYFYSNQSCEQCHPLCSQCYGPENNTCISCIGSFVLKENSCSCPDSYFYSNDSKSCLQCADNYCKTCTGSKRENCSMCLSGDLPESTTYVCCDKGFFFNSLISYCMQCYFLCHTCTDVTQESCKKCIDDPNIIKNSQLCECKDGYFPNDAEKKCDTCPPLCSKCLSSSLCLECKTNNDIRNINSTLSVSKCNCLDGYYYESSNSTCHKCHHMCSACFFHGNNSCLSCKEGENYTLENTICKCNNTFTYNETAQLCFKIVLSRWDRYSKLVLSIFVIVLVGVSTPIFVLEIISYCRKKKKDKENEQRTKRKE